MIKTSSKKKTFIYLSIVRRYFLLCFLLFLPTITFAQLSNFTLTVTPSNETCLGNGSLNFETTGTTSGSTITYYIYELPNIITPIAVQTNNFLGGRTSGNYQITAIQVLGTNQNSQTTTATINSSIIALSYLITSTNSVCNDGTLNVTITNGIGSQYEIISGPVTRPIQSSPQFTMLPSGVYQVRVYDNCGDATVITHTLQSSASIVTIGPVGFPNPELPSCNTIDVANLLSVAANQTLSYPLELTYTITPPSGSNQVITTIITSGDATSQLAEMEIPFFYDQLYTYNLTVKDGCGNLYSLNNEVNKKLSAVLIPQIAKCGGYYLTAQVNTYRPNLFIQFTDAPTGFIGSNFNSGHPGPFVSSSTDYGAYTIPVPFGHYEIQVSDGCGHTATAEITLIDEPGQPTHTATPLSGCLSYISDVRITIPRFTIVSAVITLAPITYGILPDDVSDQITPDGLLLNNLVTGNYTVILTDECGNIYTYDFFVPGLSTTVSYASRTGCELGKGSIRIRGNNTILTSIFVTDAPVTFGQTLPYNASSFIASDGSFSIGDLLPGNYSFKVTDNCGIDHDVIIDVIGYAINKNDFTITPHCGAFDISLSHFSNAVLESFWLQKYDSLTNTWQNPLTGNQYVSGTVPNALNSILISNNATTFNLAFLGNFRILKSFVTFGDGNIGVFKICFEIIKEFEFNGEIQFTGIEKIGCNGNFMDIKLYAVGVPPLKYSIILKNGLPFFVNNGTNNIFLNLEPAIYTFKVDQDCGDSRNFISDVAQLPSLAIASQLNDMTACDDSSNDGKEIFVLTNQNATVLGSQNPALYTISYHLSMNEAETNTNPLPTNYDSGNATIYCRLKYDASNCYDITTFKLIVNPYIVNAPINIILCENQTTTIIAESGFTSYNWSTGETTQSITINQSGQYILDITQTYATGICNGQFIYNVTTISPPVIDHLIINDWTDTNNSIEVVLENFNTESYQYSIDNINFQSSPIFSNLLTGFYTVYVKDSFCGNDSENAFLLNYPKYFTPNGDGYNDYWKVKFSEKEPNMMTSIYDRFGKFIFNFTPDSLGWDGTLNGKQLPSTDYWFVVIRQDGRNLKGHFAMKR
ncbi:T9SS type B sorting domain-containing protein [Flavobacterium sp. SUN052]|uniref:T9SS type B sorting domain-containing protein n=1 Tax=Flavobacterium sp. SUN052 TaxID=3002441 RepID=UPI00237EB351|nr:T9SS type B sorting domain-containing protein [Flavobacterium sp. SUN052]MEC4005790.1 T9SS type B sorting domain-containing protein [Flavobacterium sp. SUN052]